MKSSSCAHNLLLTLDSHLQWTVKCGMNDALPSYIKLYNKTSFEKETTSNSNLPSSILYQIVYYCAKYLFFSFQFLGKDYLIVCTYKWHTSHYCIYTTIMNLGMQTLSNTLQVLQVRFALVVLTIASTVILLRSLMHISHFAIADITIFQFNYLQVCS